VSECSVDYPKELPLECARELVRMVRRGDLVRERASFAKHVWNVQGYVQKLALGEPTDLAFPFQSLPTDEEAAQSLEMLTEEVAEGSEFARGLGLPAGILLRWLLARLLEVLTKE
jgi:hypothetical protein